MSRNEKHLETVGGVRVLERKVGPPVMSDKLLTLESNLCQRAFACAKAGVLYFCPDYQVYSLHAVAICSWN
jgi:hypothetical protein